MHETVLMKLILEKSIDLYMIVKKSSLEKKYEWIYEWKMSKY